MRSTTGARRKRPRARTIIAILAVMIPLTAIGVASAQATELKGIFKVFAQCPTSVPGVTLCNYADTTGGEFKIGNTTVPINKPVILQGGGIPTGNPREYFLYPAKNGESLSKTELNVPGGLTDLINCTEIKGNGFFEFLEREACKAIFENKTTGVTATTELVANEHNPALLNLNNFLEETGTTLTLPIRVHLKNPLLGSSCYIGSESSPIELHLTSGTTSPPEPNKPIKGSAGEFIEEEEERSEVLFVVPAFHENTLVDNSYSAPAAEGCGEGFSFLIDPILDLKIGLPSAAGHNTAILTGTTRSVAASEVIKSEKY